MRQNKPCTTETERQANMRLLTSFIIMLLLSANAYSLDVDDIISLSKANVGDDIILSVIAVSDENIDLSTQDIILLKKEGVSDKVVKTLIKRSKKAKKSKKKQENVVSNDEVFQEVKKETKKEVKKEVVVEKRKERVEVQEEEEEQEELKPFDQFFLSTYYSHQYGFPEKDYRSPSDILNRGLYYNSGYKNYPNARRVRVYGNSFSYDRFGFQSSPYSIIVPRRHSNRYFRSRRYNRNYRHRLFGSHYPRRHYRRCR